MNFEKELVNPNIFKQKDTINNMVIKKRGKRAISPIISTVLLIMIVIILAIIILLWSRGFVQEAILKEVAGTEKRVEQFCGEVGMTSILNSDGTFGFTNSGNVPIYKVSLKTSGGGISQNTVISPEDGGLVNPGFATIIGDNYNTYEEVKIIPILLGKAKSSGITEFTCPEENALTI
jgi:flagellin-like protein